MKVIPSVRALPARIVPLPGESLVSLVRRTAAAMGYEGPHRLRALIVDAGKVQAYVNVLRPGPILHVFAILLRQSPQMLLSMTVHRLAPTLVFPGEPSPFPSHCDSKTTLKYFARGQFPVCPACLRQDPAPYERLTWSLYSLPACREHRCSIIALCPACRRPLRPERPSVSVCRCGKSLVNLEPNCLGAAAMELAEMLEALFAQGVSCLPEMSASALCWWVERLATAAGKTPAWMLQARDRLGPHPESQDDSIAWLTAAEMITHWPDRLYEFLDLFQQVPKHRNSSTGLFCGVGALMAQDMNSGMDGIVPSVGNLFRTFARDFALRRRAETGPAARHADHMIAVGALYQKGRTLAQSLAAIKGLLHLCGLCSPAVLPPLLPVSTAELEVLRGEAAKLHLA